MFILEAGYRFTFTDYLDDVSSARYVDYSLVNGPVAVELSDRRVGDDMPVDNLATPENERLLKGRRGNPEKNDHYLMLNIKLQYYLPYQVFSKVGHGPTNSTVIREKLTTADDKSSSS